jgi:hypothetical protein
MLFVDLSLLCGIGLWALRGHVATSGVVPASIDPDPRLDSVGD